MFRMTTVIFDIFCMIYHFNANYIVNMKLDNSKDIAKEFDKEKEYTISVKPKIHRCKDCGEVVLMCNLCLKTFDSKKTFKNHMKTHKSNTYRCVFCNGNLKKITHFRDKASFLDHLASHLDGMYTFQ